jgi:hypothetical protein
MRTHGVQSLLMGGQACILYGAAEFSRDADLAILALPENLRRLENAMRDLEAVVITVPPLSADYLDRGHAVHFRCGRSDVGGMRVDVMARMRGVSPFDELWTRRTTLPLTEEDGTVLELDVLALPDLVAAKKTQRDKDWPMIRRLVEANYFAFRPQASAKRVTFWLHELRSPELLVECARAFPDAAAVVAPFRGAVQAAIRDSRASVEAQLAEEQAREIALDRAYWEPLRAELEQLRQAERSRRTR